MKLCFLLSTFCFFQITFSQEKLSGIGKFQIGTATATVIHQLSSVNKVPIKLSNKNPDGQAGTVKNKKTNSIYQLGKPEIIKDSSKKVSELFIDLPAVKVYFVDYMEVAKIPILRSFFYFYNDTLYKIYSKEVRKDFIDAVKLKYGEGSSANTNTTFSCKESGGIRKLTGTNTLTTWTNNSIKTTYYSSEMFDTLCKPLYLTYFLMADEQKEEQIKQDIEILKQKKKEEEAGRKLKSLKDF